MDISMFGSSITLLIHLFLLSVPVAPCPNDINTTCCACVSHPGCSWFRPLDGTGYCETSPYLLSGGLSSTTEFPDWSEGGLRGVFPSQANDVTVMRNEPFHLHDRRLLRPQLVRLKLAVGVRFQLAVRLTSRSTRTRLAVSGPARGTGGDVEFGLRSADANSCSRGLREQSTVRRNRSRGGRLDRTAAFSGARRARSTTSNRRDGGYPARRVYNCRGDGQGVVHNLLLDVDVKRCLGRIFTLRVLARDSGTRSRPLLVRVLSACNCPDCSSNTRDSSGSVSTITPSEPQPCDITRCRSHQTHALSPQATLCLRRGVNDECVSGDGTPAATCSGRGLCVCGRCSCQHRQQASTQRYSGAYCQCDDFSCPVVLGALCGGPGRGVCQCGQCQCHEGWTGEACDISSSADPCVSPSGEGAQVCSGRGTCVNGLCECPYPSSGQFCQCDGQACPQE